MEAVVCLEPGPLEVLIVLRADDTASHEVVVAHDSVWTTARIVNVESAGHIPPLVAALEVCSSEILAVLDDDAVPRREWASVLLQGMTDGVVAIGGPVVNHPCLTREPSLSRHAGELAWYGAPIRLPEYGSLNTHKTVQFLSGGNVAYRADALRACNAFDASLNVGAAVHYELDVGLALSKIGAILFDPEMVIDHYPGRRAGAPIRADFLSYVSSYTHNLYFIVSKHLPYMRRALFVVVMGLVGHRASPGVVRILAASRVSGVSPFALLSVVIFQGARGWRLGRASRLQGKKSS